MLGCEFILFPSLSPPRPRHLHAESRTVSPQIDIDLNIAKKHYTGNCFNALYGQTPPIPHQPRPWQEFWNFGDKATTTLPWGLIVHLHMLFFFFNIFIDLRSTETCFLVEADIQRRI